MQRHLNSLERKINVRGEKFVHCNKVLDAYLKERKKDGREETVQHKPSISDEDWSKLKLYFSDALTSVDVRKVSFYVWFHVSLHFCLRGGELQSKLRHLAWSSQRLLARKR